MAKPAVGAEIFLIGFFGSLFKIERIDAVLLDLDLFREQIKTVIDRIDIYIRITVFGCMRHACGRSQVKCQRVAQHGIIAVVRDEQPCLCTGHAKDRRTVFQLDVKRFFVRIKGIIPADPDILESISI